MQGPGAAASARSLGPGPPLSPPSPLVIPPPPTPHAPRHPLSCPTPTTTEDFTVAACIQALLSAPNPDDPLSDNTAKHWKSNEVKTVETAKEWTRLYASGA
ncbi:Ubiquitin-conjugating enzyme E2 36 [Zea mays]|uniref:Ubiquitin-conjugating enzyme E2 36 n=1 Tax=Zea mays TaxID=4577 RepID=A0A1D6P0Y8_MAIZE|nr:Ubiquitin-conjugating enzyme E2 36 [Zea mays]